MYVSQGFQTLRQEVSEKYSHHKNNYLNTQRQNRQINLYLKILAIFGATVLRIVQNLQYEAEI